jgi:hypothetical protein
MRTVKSAAVQLRPVLYSREGTVDRRAVRHFLPKGWCLTVLIVHSSRPRTTRLPDATDAPL